MRRRRLELGWTQKRTAADIGVSEDTLRDWELGTMEPKPKKLPRIAAFLGYEPDIDRFDAPRLLGRLLDHSGITIQHLADETGLCTDTLVNLREGRYQPARRTYQKLAQFALNLHSPPRPCPPELSRRSSSKRRKS
ncbi:helix-turn-helix transcriptional regulator [Haloferula sp. BvORR071]|uniref:helix-turn-helix domain-containing protein n=1 Tax=Haloferula sp. BvORR071 TaxID=1396141 RepID=UPI002240F968|nr:helix-turn-helix transcriptional regulator [Haloferula sp. BvORR071]